MAQSSAWRSLSGSALKVLIELHCRFNGGNNGRLTLGWDEAARLLGIGKATVQRALDELIEKGFVRRTKAGHWYGRQATEWAVTDRGINGSPPTNEWRNWAQTVEPEKRKSVLKRTDKPDNMVRSGTDECFHGPLQNPSDAQTGADMVRSGTAYITMLDEQDGDSSPKQPSSAAGRQQQDGQPGLALDEGSAFPDVADAVRARLKAEKISQAALAAWLHVSRPQVSNRLAGRFGLNPGAEARLRAFAAGEASP